MFIAGLLLTCCGVPSFIVSLISLYKLDQTPHSFLMASAVQEAESKIAIWVIVSFVLIVAGIILMIFGKLKRKNQNLIDTINHTATPQYCEHCKVNTTSQTGRCPICGNKLIQKGKGTP